MSMHQYPKNTKYVRIIRHPRRPAMVTEMDFFTDYATARAAFVRDLRNGTPSEWRAALKGKSNQFGKFMPIEAFGKKHFNLVEVKVK